MINFFEILWTGHYCLAELCYLLCEFVFFVAFLKNLEFNFTCLLNLTIRNFTEAILLKQVNFQ